MMGYKQNSKEHEKKIHNGRDVFGEDFTREESRSFISRLANHEAAILPANLGRRQSGRLLDREVHDGDDSFNGMGVATKSSARSNANNEIEMRQLFHSNKHRSLEDVSHELLGNDRGPNSERARQVFAMLWYVAEC